MAAIRTFIAIPLDPDLKQGLAQLQHGLQAKQDSGLKWTAPDNLHFTMAFLGYVPEERAPEIIQTSSQAVAPIAPFTFTLGGLGIFPPKGMGRVLWIGVAAGAAELTALQGAIQGALQAKGFQFEDREYVPHLTLARARQDEVVDRALADLDTSSLAGRTQRVTAIRVMRSDLSRSGPAYTVLASGPLHGHGDGSARNA